MAADSRVRSLEEIVSSFHRTLIEVCETPLSGCMEILMKLGGNWIGIS